MIISNLAKAAPPVPEKAMPPTTASYPRVYGLSWTKTKSKQVVTEDSAKKVATAYRCANTISDDIAMMPWQVFNSYQGKITRIYPNFETRNTAFLLERKPNRWMTPFIFKKTIVNWLIWWGNSYIWEPLSRYRELFILDASRTYPVFDQDGDKWYATTFPNNSNQLIPDAEMTHVMINSKDGLTGLAKLEYSRETIGRQLAAHETQDSISGNGLQPVAAISVDSKGKPLDQNARENLKKSYIDAVDGNVAVFDSTITGFQTITMKATDAQFLEGIAATDADIANFFNFPLHKLNMGKQSYESNEQQQLDYIQSCLNSFLIQMEQAAGMKWFSEVDQPFMYTKFNRDSLLQMNAETRTKVHVMRIQSGIETPNEALQIEDQNGYDGGDRHYMPANMMAVGGTQNAGN